MTPDPTSGRPATVPADVLRVGNEIIQRTEERLAEKGRGIFVSSHEILGILEEERDELCTAVRINNPKAIRRELLDIAVGALYGIVSIDSGRMDWL